MLDHSFGKINFGEAWTNMKIRIQEETMVEVKTPLDDLLETIRKHGKISLKDLHTILEIPANRIEKWLLMLEKKIEELYYPLFGRIKVKINGNSGSNKLLWNEKVRPF